MKALLLPIVLLLLGTGGGVGAGLFLAPPADAEKEIHADNCVVPEMTDDILVATAIDVAEREFAKLNNQFIIPLVEDGTVAALVVLSLNLEVKAGNRPAIFAVEPKLRDRFLQVMFDHANSGGFSGNFTIGTKMQILRDDLLRVAQDVSGDLVTDVLVIDIVRQDS